MLWFCCSQVGSEVKEEKDDSGPKHQVRVNVGAKKDNCSKDFVRMVKGSTLYFVGVRQSTEGTKLLQKKTKHKKNRYRSHILFGFWPPGGPGSTEEKVSVGGELPDATKSVAVRVRENKG